MNPTIDGVASGAPGAWQSCSHVPGASCADEAECSGDGGCVRLWPRDAQPKGPIPFPRDKPGMYPAPGVQDRFGDADLAPGKHGGTVAVMPSGVLASPSPPSDCGCVTELKAMLTHPALDFDYKRACQCALYPEDQRCECHFCLSCAASGVDTSDGGQQ